jgi:hypothetical protein
MSIVNPCATIIASVQPSRDAASSFERAAAGGERVALAAVRGHQAEVCD